MSTPVSLAVIIASLGRPNEVAIALNRLAQQTRLPVLVILSVEGAGDLPDPLPDTPALRVEVIEGPRGSSVQRNRALDRLAGHADVVAIFDDDYVPSRHALDGIVRSFASFPEASGLCGSLLADGAASMGITPQEAIRMVEDFDSSFDPTRDPAQVAGMAGVYGCNMAFRMRDVGDLRFDENVPLYGWLEDSDFGARLPGPVIYVDALVGVHCAVKTGRESRGRRLGYSQVMNPVYFWRKGSMSLRRILPLVLRPIAANIAKSPQPEPWIDRKGRLQGNLLALSDLFRGRITPGRILKL